MKPQNKEQRVSFYISREGICTAKNGYDWDGRNLSLTLIQQT